MMALNQEEIQRLENAGLTNLFEKHTPLWKKLADEAFRYVEKYIPDDTRVDDVILALEPALAVTPTLQNYLLENKLRQKYWNRYFGDYILDQLWEELGEAE